MVDIRTDKSTWSGEGIVLGIDGVVLDVADIEKVAAFWASVLGVKPGPIRGEGGWLTVGALNSTTSLVLQQVPEPKVAKNRCHMCFVVTDVNEAISRIVALGGSLISEPRVGGGVTMTDPEGNEFCIGALRRTKEGTRVPVHGAQG